MVAARLLTICLLSLGCIADAAAAPPPADLVLYDAHVVTVARHQPEAQALAIRGRRIVAVGTDAEVRSLVGPHTRAIDLHGQTVVPGFVDSHAHFLDTGEALSELDVSAAQAPTWDDVVRKVAEAVKHARPGEWIIGNGWHQEHWTHPPQPSVDGLPTGEALDAVSPDNPVVLWHASGHGMFVNRKALEVSGIGPKTPDPPGGEIVRDKQGRAIGMLRDDASTPVLAALKKSMAGETADQRRQRLLKWVDLATRNALENGVTSWQDMGQPFEMLDFYKQLAEQGRLHLRLYAWVGRESTAAIEAQLKNHYLVDYGKYGHLTIRGIGEVLSDGALGTHSAWFFKPYRDVPTTSGYPVTSMADVKALSELAIANGFQMSVHAIGTRANHEVLDVFQQVMDEHPDATDLRWRIDHVQHLVPGDIPRFHALHVIASMQTGHACDDGPYVVKRIGEERAANSYAWHALIADRTIIANGTDAPVIPVDTLPNFYCAVTRRERFDPAQPAFHPEQAMTRMEALRSYTANGAYSMFEEGELGTLEPGKLADIVVLDRDIMTGPATDILKTHVVYTLVDGQVLYHRGEGFSDALEH